MFTKSFVLTQFFCLLSLIVFAQSSTKEQGVASHYSDALHGNLTASGEPYDKHLFTAAHKTLPFGTQVQVLNMENQKSVVVKINDRGPFVEGRIIDLSLAAAKVLNMIEPGTIPVELTVVQFDTVHKEHIEEHFQTDTITKSSEEELDTTAEVNEVASSEPTTPSETPETSSEVSPDSTTADAYVDTSAHPIGHTYDSHGDAAKPWGYGIQVSATHSYENAVHYAELLQDQGFAPTFIEANLVGSEKYYRIIIGNYATRALAEGEQTRLLQKGLNGFIKQHIEHP